MDCVLTTRRAMFLGLATLHVHSPAGNGMAPFIFLFLFLKRFLLHDFIFLKNKIWLKVET